MVERVKPRKRCALGWHDWTFWEPRFNFNKNMRRCRGCGLIQTKAFDPLLT